MHPVGNGLGATVTPLDLLPPPLVLPAATSYWQVAFFCVGVPPKVVLDEVVPRRGDLEFNRRAPRCRPRTMVLYETKAKGPDLAARPPRQDPLRFTCSPPPGGSRRR